MARRWKIVLAALMAFSVLGLLTLPALLRTVLQRGEVTEEQARLEISQPPVSTPTDVRQRAQVFWISAISPGTLAPREVELRLSADPVQRARQLLTALINRAPTAAQRTLPAETELLGFYMLADGTAIANFSQALATGTPSGILSEQMAADSILRTLAANMDSVRRLRILIHGREAETLAGHLNLTAFFPVASPAAPAAAGAATVTAPEFPDN